MVNKKVPKLSSISQGTSAAIKRKTQLDGWLNILTGIGSSRDKITYSEVSWTPTPRQQADSLYAGDDLGGKIASIIPFDGVRAGISWNIQDAATNDEIIPWLDDEFTRLKVWTKLYEAWVWARVFGGSIIVLSVDDGLELDQPLDTEKFNKLNTLNVFDRWQWEIRQEDINGDPSSPYYGQPEYYVYVGDDVGSYGSRFNNIASNGFYRVHRSRVIRFDGVHLSNRLWKMNQYWHDSIFGKLYEPLRNYTMVHNSVASMLQEFNQPVFKITGLATALQQDQDELVVKKLQQVNLSRSVARAVAIDSEDSFENVEAQTSGIDTLVQKTIDRLTAASHIPHTRLMGESPAGLGGSGRSELTDYYDFIGSQQKIYLYDPLVRLTKMIFSQAESPFEEPVKWSFKFNPLEVPTQKEIKETELIQANIDDIYMRNGVIDSFEVASSRFGSGTYSYETHLEQGPNTPRTAIEEPINLEPEVNE